MSNSSLVNYTKISPNKTSPRNHKIDTISIHCMAGNLTVESCGNVFASSDRKASSNYGIDSNGRIGMYVEEKDRSWCTSSSSNDNRAITIEVANTVAASPWPISDAAYKSLINLLVDICKRNNIKQLLWKGDKSLIGQVTKQNMTVHRWFAAKDCPGDYLYNLHGQIASEVNAKLGVTSSSSTGSSSTSTSSTLYKVQVGAYSNKTNADEMLKKIKNSGFDGIVVKVDNLYKVQVGAYSNKTNANSVMTQLKQKGFSGFIVSTNSTTNSEIKVGSTVKVVNGAKTYTGGSLASFVYSKQYKVKTISGDRVVIAENNTIIAAMNKKDLILIS